MDSMASTARSSTTDRGEAMEIIVESEDIFRRAKAGICFAMDYLKCRRMLVAAIHYFTGYEGIILALDGGSISREA